MSNYKPLQGKVIVEIIDEIKSSIIAMPDSAVKKNKATVIAVGLGTEESPMEVNPGDVVVLRTSGLQNKLEDDRDIYVVFQSDILTIVED